MDVHIRTWLSRGQKGGASVGCCTHGAFFSDRADEKRVRRMAPNSPQQIGSCARWESPRTASWRSSRTTASVTIRTRRRTRIVDGACLRQPGGFRRRPRLRAARARARTGRAAAGDQAGRVLAAADAAPHDWVDRPDDTRVLQSRRWEYDRRGWGPAATTCTGGARRRHSRTAAASRCTSRTGRAHRADRRGLLRRAVSAVCCSTRPPSAWSPSIRPTTAARQASNL